MNERLRQDIEEFRHHFDSMYIGAIPRLLDETGAFLAFSATLSAIDTLAGAWSPTMGTGERFRGFVKEFFEPELAERAEDLWRFRNLMVHAFNPGPFALVCNQSRLHLTPHGEVTVLNVQDFYASLVLASKRYFTKLRNDEPTADNFAKRILDKDGGAPEVHIHTRST